MNQNWIVLHAICVALNEKLEKWKFVDAYSNGPEELVLVFKQLDAHFAIKCHFLDGAMYLSFMEDIPSPGTKALFWFKGNRGTEVKEFVPHGLDRSFRLVLSSGACIAFKMYGRMSNVLYYSNDVEQIEESMPTEVFRTAHKMDLEWKLQDFPTYIDFAPGKSKEELAVANKHLPKPVMAYLLEKFDGSMEGFELFAKKEIDLLSQAWTLAPAKTGYDISLFGDAFTSILEACNQLIRKHFPLHTFLQLKKNLLQGKQRELKKTEKQIAAFERNREKVVKRKSNKEIADIIMANLHLIQKGETKVELFDFYENKNIQVKLNKNLSPQDNAAKYYKKSKSGGKEKEELDKKLQSFKWKRDALEMELLEIEEVEDLKSLRKLNKEVHKEGISKQKASPYWEFDVDGMTLMVGKSAANNDILLRMAKKEDWWFHAKDVAGSHCLLRNGGKELTAAQLEKIGGIAAYYSKAKSQSVVPVIYTLKKYVRKPKGFLPGKVIVEKEEVVLVEPARPNE